MDTTAIRAALQQDLDALLRRHHAISNHLHNRDREVPQDFAEQATFAENDEVLEALDDTTRAKLSALEAALRRMDEGTWTECAGCGEQIGERRLEAMPTATLCIDCAAELDGST